MQQYWAIEELNELLGTRHRRSLPAQTKDEALAYVNAKAARVRKFVVIELIDSSAAGAYRVVCSVRGEL